jgi:hypothetical protein
MTNKILKYGWNLSYTLVTATIIYPFIVYFDNYFQ